ncbi:serine hydrolase domain-containing protein [Pseudoflavitalea rhizosphaerae]|uniref:serine hydrolase domain-containing protein n=1 Tax=Pseudoflavitalea rhizosphaerae TaxID=1884793 RepID=UPI000F8CD127|nr:serine hydrolase domain-containing protein [Pseudoflavitalea rhizosphaerae]
MTKYQLLLAIPLFLIFSCKKDKSGDDGNPPDSAALYFPTVSGTEWQTSSAASLKWDQPAIDELYTYLDAKNTKAFIVLKNGKIVLEKYFGSFTQNSDWYWASAGKTMTAFLTGIAQEEGLLRLSDKTSKYLGTGWTSLTTAEEDLITIRHQLTMTTGLDDGVAESDCTSPECLIRKADAGARWAYHNAPYTLMDKVIEAATGKTFQNYFQQKIRDRIGMKGIWLKSGYNNVYGSDARSMARFGLLLLNKGKWGDVEILKDQEFFNAQINSSQQLNPSYGYLTWLNGKTKYMLPTLQVVFNGPLTPNAPSDMYCALGKNDQKIYVVPSQKLVVIRMGESAGNVQLAASSFDNELWGKLKSVIGF